MNNLILVNPKKNRRSYYVYVILDPQTRSVTYVGKGSRNRVNDHKDKIKLILAYNMTEDEALALEAALIALFKCEEISNMPKLRNKISGQRARSPYKIGPFQISAMQRNIINADLLLVLDVSNSYNGNNLRHAIQYDWRLNPDRASNVDYILAESNGVIVGVFKADSQGWARVNNNSNRYYIVNPIQITDQNVCNKYIGNTSFVRKKGEKNPVRYFIF